MHSWNNWFVRKIKEKFNWFFSAVVIEPDIFPLLKVTPPQLGRAKIRRNIEMIILFIVKNYNKSVFEDSFLFLSSPIYNLIIQ